jgi:hypothetical protein
VPDDNNRDLFRPFPFATRAVETAPASFDYREWKKAPSAPVIVKGALDAWPLFKELRTRPESAARLDYLAQAFGSNSVGYTTVPASDPIMGFDDKGKQNFKYSPAECTVAELCAMMKERLGKPDAEILYARGGANSVRTWRGFPEAIRPLPFLEDMIPNGEGLWLGSGRQVSYLHQDAHFNLMAMLAGVKRVLLYPLEAIADLYPTPFFGGIAGTTSSFVRPLTPDLERFPSFLQSAKHAWTAILDEGDVLLLPPCWWHYVEAAPGVNLMINVFMWALPPKKEFEFEAMMRRAVAMSLRLSPADLAALRGKLYEGRGEPSPSAAAKTLGKELERFLRPDIPGYWQRIAKTYYDYYIFQTSGQPVPNYPERHVRWAEAESSLLQRARQWYRFRRGLVRMGFQRKRATGVVP